MTLKSSLSLLVVFLLGLSVACQRKAVSTSVDMSADNVRKELTKGTWMLANLDDGPAKLMADQKMPSLTFTEDGKVSGYSGFLDAVNTTDNFTINDGVLALNVARRMSLATLTRKSGK